MTKLVDWHEVRDVSIMVAPLVVYLIFLFIWGCWLNSQEVYTVTITESFYCYVNSGKGCPAFFADVLRWML